MRYIPIWFPKASPTTFIGVPYRRVLRMPNISGGVPLRSEMLSALFEKVVATCGASSERWKVRRKAALPF
jgi:hypothetical protein